MVGSSSFLSVRDLMSGEFDPVFLYAYKSNAVLQEIIVGIPVVFFSIIS